MIGGEVEPMKGWPRTRHFGKKERDTYVCLERCDVMFSGSGEVDFCWEVPETGRVEKFFLVPGVVPVGDSNRPNVFCTVRI